MANHEGRVPVRDDRIEEVGGDWRFSINSCEWAFCMGCTRYSRLFEWFE